MAPCTPKRAGQVSSAGTGWVGGPGLAVVLAGCGAGHREEGELLSRVWPPHWASRETLSDEEPEAEGREEETVPSFLLQPPCSLHFLLLCTP